MDQLQYVQCRQTADIHVPLPARPMYPLTVNLQIDSFPQVFRNKILLHVRCAIAHSNIDVEDMSRVWCTIMYRLGAAAPCYFMLKLLTDMLNCFLPGPRCG